MEKVKIVFPQKKDYPQQLSALKKKNDPSLYFQLLESAASAYFETNFISRYLFKKRFQIAVDLIGKKTQPEILDAGCGIGFFLPTLAKIGKHIWAVDNAPHSLSYARFMCQKRKIKNVSFKKINLELPFPFPQEKFDLIVCLSVLEHVKKLDKAIYNLKKVLKRKGILIVGYPNENNLIFRLLQSLEQRLLRPAVYETFQGLKLVHVSKARQIERVVRKHFYIEKTRYLGLTKLVNFYHLHKCSPLFS